MSACLARTCHSWASCSDAGGTGQLGEYAYLANGHLIEVAEKVENTIAAAMITQP